MEKSGGTKKVPVTLIITRKVPPERHAEFQAWMRKGILLAAGFPGFLGAGVLAPDEQGQTFQVMLRFVDDESLNRWERSLSRRMWLEHGETLMLESESKHLPGMELIFGKQDAPVTPPKWKRASSLWLFVFPVSLCLNTSITLLMPSAPLSLRVLMVTMMQVPLMVYVGAPFVHRVLRKWLYAPTAKAG